MNIFGDSPNTNLTRPVNWNDEHVFTGGQNGQVLIYDNSQSDNGRWVDALTLPVFDITNPPFNAPNSGVVSATLQIQTALDAAVAQGGGLIMIPPGEYLIEGASQHGGTALAINGGENIALLNAGGTFIAGNSCGRMLGIYNSTERASVRLKADRQYFSSRREFC